MRLFKASLAVAAVGLALGSRGPARADGFGPFKLPPISIPDPLGGKASLDRVRGLADEIKRAASPDAVRRAAERLLGSELGRLEQAATRRLGVVPGEGGAVDLRGTPVGEALALELSRLAVGDRREAAVDELSYSPARGLRIKLRLSHAQTGLPIVVRQSIEIDVDPVTSHYNVSGNTGEVESSGGVLAAPLVEVARRLPIFGKTFAFRGKVPGVGR